MTASYKSAGEEEEEEEAEEQKIQRRSGA